MWYGGQVYDWLRRRLHAVATAVPGPARRSATRSLLRRQRRPASASSRVHVQRLRGRVLHGPPQDRTRLRGRVHLRRRLWVGLSLTVTYTSHYIHQIHRHKQCSVRSAFGLETKRPKICGLGLGLGLEILVLSYHWSEVGLGYTKSEYDIYANTRVLQCQLDKVPIKQNTYDFLQLLILQEVYDTSSFYVLFAGTIHVKELRHRC